MHQPDSDRDIETTIDGERVVGTVHHAGSSDISVTLGPGSSGLTDGVHMPYFARGVHPEGFLGDYGQMRALQLLEELYRQQKRSTERRDAFARSRGEFEEFGRIRYLAASPGHSERDRIILEKGEIDKNVWVQFEDDAPYRFARLFDADTGQPFLAEASVFERTLAEYLDGVKQDAGFQMQIERTRHKLLPQLVRYANLLKAYGVTPRQFDLLQNFGRAWRTGDLGLDTQEIEGLIERGYLTRDRQRCVNERATLEQAAERCLKDALAFDAAGKAGDAARSRARAEKLQRQSETKTLLITPSGKALAKQSVGSGSELR